jgi:signal transduction histidine kinase
VSAPFPQQRTDAWSVAAVAVATVLLAWQPSWWTTAAFVLAVAVFLSCRRRAITRYDRTLEENRRLRARVHEFDSLQGRFVGSVAHEIKTPLAVVVGEMELLRSNYRDSELVRGIAKSVTGEVRHLSDLVDSFLQLAHPLVDEGTASYVPVFVSDVVIEAVGRCRELSKKLGVRVVTLLSLPDNGDPSAEVMGDPLLLEVMVENLLRNGLRSSPPGAQVELTTHTDAVSVTIIVRDCGIGIPTEHHDLVYGWAFDGPDRSVRTTGIGFGLAITRRVVDHHGGTITLRHAPGAGCEFVVTLRRCWPTGAAPTDAAKGLGETPLTTDSRADRRRA